MRAVSRLAAFSFAIALASSGCGGVGSAEDCKPATSTIAFDSYPNGNYDIFESHLINADGTGRRLLAQHGIDPAWSPDGCRIAFIRWPGSGSNELYVVNADGSDPRRLHRLVPFQADEPSWSPDGDRIAFTRYLNDDTSDVYVVDADGSNLRRLTGRAGRSFGSYYPAWSPDGRRIAFVRHNIYVIDADGTGLRRLTTSPPDPESRGDFPFVWSPDGQRIAFVRRSDARGVDIYVVRADGSGLRRLTRSGEADEPAWSPDGRRIVFSQTVPAGDFDQADLYIVNADGSGLRRLTKTPHLEAEPVWSPQ